MGSIDALIARRGHTPVLLEPVNLYLIREILAHDLGAAIRRSVIYYKYFELGISLC